jgi:hypothetical protein
MVDYTDFEDLKIFERKKFLYVSNYITGPPQREEILREIKNETVIKFLLKYATMNFLRG